MTTVSREESDDGLEALASSLVVAWDRYVRLFGEPPHGTRKQMRALLRLSPTFATKAKP